MLLLLKTGGASSTENGADTVENTKVPDVIWASFERRRTAPYEMSWTRAPEICVEIVTPDDPPEEERHKAQLYLRAGAAEFWICNELGEMRFCDPSGWLERSRLFEEFPVKVEVTG